MLLKTPDELIRVYTITGLHNKSHILLVRQKNADFGEKNSCKIVIFRPIWSRFFFCSYLFSLTTFGIVWRYYHMRLTEFSIMRFIPLLYLIPGP